MPRASAYFDTSVVVKRYVHEAGAVRARTLLRRYRFVSSALTPVEALSALNRRRRAGDLATTDFEAIIARLQRDRAIWDLVSLSPTVLGLAEQVVRDTPTSAHSTRYSSLRPNRFARCPVSPCRSSLPTPASAMRPYNSAST
ncbi:MAG: type II toxin-antitoxin system VapC family toxin [Deltaproteobacteria bacterium]|nr:type II toxin-antitoxin system VapC family toxin [Deltaproteobacteria bacterium]MBI3386384.1 type II toxin-antitoxin system VapC family toxin [Deltaproteobacteria bacterium]